MRRLPATAWLWLTGAAALFAAGAGYASTPGQGSGPLAPGLDDPSTHSDPASVKVVLHCRVKADATVDQCTVVSETPPGHNLGAAAVRMSSQIKIDAETFSPDMVGQMIDVPLSFAPATPPDGDMPNGVAAKPM
jgi:hypothetical protein